MATVRSDWTPGEPPCEGAYMVAEWNQCGTSLSWCVVDAFNVERYLGHIPWPFNGRCTTDGLMGLGFTVIDRREYV